MRTGSFDNLNRASGGALKKKLRQWRKGGVSFDRISRNLEHEGIDVSRTTVHRWCHELGFEDAEAS